jgi:alpha-1,6-mannosyltransferase
MTAIYGANPFYQTVSQFPQDPFYHYAAWLYYPSAYGPGWELLAAELVRIAGDGVVANVLAFKLVGVAAYAATSALIALTLRRLAPERALYGTVLFAWNPLVLYVTAGNGHNDALMLLFVVLGLYWLARGHFTLAALAETAGALVKFIPILLLPIVFIVALKQSRSPVARLMFLIGTLALCAVLAAAAYAPFWRGGDILGITRRSDLYTTSIPAMIHVSLMPAFGKFSEFIATRFAVVLLGAWIMRQMRIVWRRGGNTRAAIRASLSILVFYLLVSCPWFQAWYTIWPVALAALVPEGTLALGALLLSYIVTWKMPIFEYVLVPGPTLPPTAWREWRLTPTTLGTAWAFFVYTFVRQRIKHAPRIARRQQTTRAGQNQNAPDSPSFG